MTAHAPFLGPRKTTAELVAGDRLLINGRLVRTVARVERSAFVNYRDEPIFYVMYAEGDTPEWSGGNSGIGSTGWTLADPDDHGPGCDGPWNCVCGE